jgi:hypothetical protein
MSATSTHPYATGLRWLKRLASGHPHQIIGSEGNPYMLRWYVIPRNPLLNVYVHKFIRSDDDRALHDHPWWFVSLILRGGYVEISENIERKTTVLCRTSVFDVRSPFWRRAVAYRPAIYRHRVALPVENGIEQSCWTLIVTGPKRRSWGFWCKQAPDRYAENHAWGRERFVHWREWGDGGCGETA